METTEGSNKIKFNFLVELGEIKFQSLNTFLIKIFSFRFEHALHSAHQCPRKENSRFKENISDD